MPDQRQLPDRRTAERGGRRLIDLYRFETGNPLTPLELASMTGLTYPQVIEDIRRNELIAVKVQRGERIRYIVLWENARAWVQQLGFFVQLERLDRLEKHGPPSAA